MEYVEPITKMEDIERVKSYFKKRNYRNYILFSLGINCGLRISDLLKLKAVDVRNQGKLKLREEKTGKSKMQKLPYPIYELLQDYVKDMEDEDFLFSSRVGTNKPITRQQAHKLIKIACADLGIDRVVGTHTLRKTFGYHFYKAKKDIALLQDIYNHSSPSITLRYIGINQENIDNAMSDFYL